MFYIGTVKFSGPSGFQISENSSQSKGTTGLPGFANILFLLREDLFQVIS